MPSFTRVVTAPIGAGIVAALLWWVADSIVGGPGQGWLKQQPWPLGNLAACVAIVAGLAFLQALAGWWRAVRQNADLGAEAARLGFEYQAAVSRADLGEAIHLRAFEHWHEAWNRLRGRFEGVDLQMVDVTSLQRSYRRPGSHGHSDTRTIVVIPVPAKDWPLFEIHPRGLSTWLWDLLGCRGVRFRFRDEHLASRPDRSVLARFNRRYRLFIGVAERIAHLAGTGVGLPLGKMPACEAELRDRFSVRAIQRLAGSRGWTVESNGTHAAFWRPARVIPAADREAILREVVELYRALAEPADRQEAANLLIETTECDQAMLSRRLAGLIAGALAGMVVAMAICVPLLMAMPFETAKWFVFVWPLLGTAFMALGAYLGARFGVWN